MPRINTVNARALPTCPRCQRTFRARIGLVGHLYTQCNNNPTKLISTTPASDATMTTTTATTDTHFIDLRRLQSPTPSSLLHPLRRSRQLTPLAPPPPQHQRWGSGTNLSSLRLHIHLTHRPGRSLANPSHID
ncbi:unnamed protein product [Schistocephalus solidus]|uniref:C2H2-type domain-containing protein n=1 Tax=Schistocephalus solidus TaxID=70667 RepID=A0A183SDP4_SCHSO|nr:unnamed protein product [Schistocephalus solidus]